ncbi:MAG TPA: beta-ribofuranosylaminobenzene 5'-phosphate synthase family protein [Acetobacteraceae bacterium]|nr:beta-ribofuranosylaminobenzene 5'-phosphate synthase family protein [Acetobacteraceae bacterium]
MSEAVVVESGARLHMGFLDLGGTLGRRFGSIGMALDRPQTRLRLVRTDETCFEGPDRDRAANCHTAIMRHLGLTAHHKLSIVSAIPAHAGLGSGTQLALGVAAAVRRLHGIPADPFDDAGALNRGARSGIGIGLFAHGGFVVDGGRGARAAPPPMLTRIAVPKSWRILLLQDPRHSGLSGSDETAGFAALPPFSDALAGHLCRLVLLQVLPALIEDDLAQFGDAITRIQRLLGDHFAPAQGGRIASPAVAAALSLLAAEGATGLGQSSWGPTGFGFIRGAAAAERLADRVRRSPHGSDLQIEICRPRNCGATISDPA